MPIYLYVCKCGKTFEDIQPSMTGSRDIDCDACGEKMGRDYHEEKAGVIEDWEPGYNPGIDEHYTSKADLLSKIRRKGFYPSVHGGGVSVGGSKAGLYGDEEFKDVLKPSKPVDVEGLTNEPPVVR